MQRKEVSLQLLPFSFFMHTFVIRNWVSLDSFLWLTLSWAQEKKVAQFFLTVAGCWVIHHFPFPQKMQITCTKNAFHKHPKLFSEQAKFDEEVRAFFFFLQFDWKIVIVNPAWLKGSQVKNVLLSIHTMEQNFTQRQQMVTDFLLSLKGLRWPVNQQGVGQNMKAENWT